LKKLNELGEIREGLNSYQLIKTKSGGKLVKINRQWIVGEGNINDIQT